jgi:hypothetical protein
MKPFAVRRESFGCKSVLIWHDVSKRREEASKLESSFISRKILAPTRKGCSLV